MNCQLTKLTKELKVKDDAIKKAYIIIETQQQQIRQLTQQQSQSTSCRSSVNRKISKSLYEAQFQGTLTDYKNELQNILTYDNLFETLLANQIRNQQIIIYNNKLLQLEEEITYWQNERQMLLLQLEKAVTLYTLMEQQNQDLQFMISQINLENKVARQIIAQLVQSENNSHMKLSLIDLLSSMSIQALNQSFQSFSGFIFEIVQHSTSQKNSKPVADTYQVLDLKSENKQLLQQQLQNEIFLQEVMKILNLEPEQNSHSSQLLIVMKSLKQLKHKDLMNSESDKENNINNTNSEQYHLRLQTLINQYNTMISQILEQFNQPQNVDQIIQQLCCFIKSLLTEILDSKRASLKFLNGLNSSYRLIRNSLFSLRD